VSQGVKTSPQLVAPVLDLSKEMAGPVVGPAARIRRSSGPRFHDRTRPRLAGPRDGASRRPSFPDGATKVPLGASWVPQGATPVAPKIKEVVAPCR
jgi:hypothetical protein